MSKVVRAYHFVPANHGLDDLRNRRLKIARLDELNDPFELWAVAQPNKELREGLRRSKARLAQNTGALCFSLSWRNPLMWSHYADRHRGLALGFDVHESNIKEMNYVSKRPIFEHIDENFSQLLLYTKYVDWSYEKEARSYTTLQDPDKDSGLYFKEFGSNLALQEVIVGPLSSVKQSALKAALRELSAKVQVTKARIAFNSFRIVRDRRGCS
jgi:hypothetical protein